MGVQLSPTSAWEDVGPWRDEESGGGARYNLKAWRRRQPLHPLQVDDSDLNHNTLDQTMKMSSCDIAVHGTPGSAAMEYCGEEEESTQVCEGCACILTGGEAWLGSARVRCHLFVFMLLCGGISKLCVLSY